MGCGRVGSTIAHILEDQGHSVAVIDQEAEAFRKLRSGFKGSKITGIGFDREILIEAGIEHADAFAAVSSGDNSNVIAARVARESFSVQTCRGANLRSAPRRGIPAARHPHRGHRALDRGPDAAQAASGRLRTALARPDRHRRACRDRLLRCLARREGAVAGRVRTHPDRVHLPARRGHAAGAGNCPAGRRRAARHRPGRRPRPDCESVRQAGAPGKGGH